VLAADRNVSTAAAALPVAFFPALALAVAPAPPLRRRRAIRV